MIPSILFVLCSLAFAITAFYFCAGRHDPNGKDPFQ